jgi:hypothetical protein
MKKVFFILLVFALETSGYAQKILAINHFSNIFINIQSMIEIGTDTIRVGGITPEGFIHWMDFKTIFTTQPFRKSSYLFKPNLNFLPTALQLLDADHVLLAGSRHQDTLEWALWNLDSMRSIRGGLLPDSLRKGQINVVHRLNNGTILFGGKKYGDMLLIQMDAFGKVQKVLHNYKELKDEIFDILECDNNRIMISGYLKDNMLNEKLIYILNMDSSLAVQQTRLLGHPDSLNVGYSSILTPQKWQIIAGTTGTDGVVMWLDSLGTTVQQLSLKVGSKHYKNLKIQNNHNKLILNRRRIWATDETGAMTVFWISSLD